MVDKVFFRVEPQGDTGVQRGFYAVYLHKEVSEEDSVFVACFIFKTHLPVLNPTNSTLTVVDSTGKQLHMSHSTRAKREWERLGTFYVLTEQEFPAIIQRIPFEKTSNRKYSMLLMRQLDRETQPAVTATWDIAADHPSPMDLTKAVQHARRFTAKFVEFKYGRWYVIVVDRNPETLSSPITYEEVVLSHFPIGEDA